MISKSKYSLVVSPTFALTVLIVAFVFLNASWLWYFRHGQLLDIDEAGYLGIALVDYQGFLHNGLLGFLSMVDAPSIQAPLTTALAALIFIVVGPHVIASFAVTVLCAAGCIPASYALAKDIGMQRLALAASLLVASCPMIINYSRNFQFSMPATLVATLALLALLRSNRMSKPGWAGLFGLCLGLLPLARTMTLAFLPALLVGAVCHVYGSGFLGWQRRTLIFSLSLFSALLVGLSWFIPNGAYVFHYLVGFGFGHRAAEFNPGNVNGGLAALQFSIAVLADYICLPQFLLLLLAVLIGVELFARAIYSRGLQVTLGMLLCSPVLPVLVFVVGVLFALTSSANKGDGFIAPAIPAMLVLCCLAFDIKLRERSWRRAFCVLIVTLAAFNVIANLGLPMFAEPLYASIPYWGTFNVTSGSGAIQAYEIAGDYFGGEWNWPVSQVDGLRIAQITHEVAVRLSSHTTAFAFRDRLFNVNTVGLNQLLLDLPRSSFIQIEPMATGITQADVVTWLTLGNASVSCLLLLSDQTRHQFLPVIQPSEIAFAANRAHFKPTGAEWILPDGEHLNLWRRQDCQ